MRKRAFVLGATLLATSVASVAACSSMDDAESVGTNPDAGKNPEASVGSPDATAPGDAGSVPLEANGLVLVHAAHFPAFRMCFENGGPQERPLPHSELMPESNLVGVDVGTAVRLPPRTGMVGRAFVFPERDLRVLYPTFGGAGAGPTCTDLLDSKKSLATELPRVDVDISAGVHALVLVGCLPAASDIMASKVRCGEEWEPVAGNLTLEVVRLPAYRRAPGSGLPIQIVQLSPGLARKAAGRALGIGFGPLASEGGAPPQPLFEGEVPFGVPVPKQPAILDVESADVASYATSGVFVTVGGAVDDAGVPVDAGESAAPREIVLAQSLADIQRRSASRSLPADWFAVASSYALLSVGDPDPRLADGGTDDDPRRALHLLAVPLAAPDAGAPDASP